MVTMMKRFFGIGMIALSVLTVSANASSSLEFYAAPDGEGGGESITWINVTLESAGSLGVEVMYKVDKLTDVDYLKVTGPLNDADWTTLKNMTSLKGLDLRQATSDAIPAEEFEDRSSLTLVYLPEGMKTIGNEAFHNTKLTTISIPASVTSIGGSAFYGVKTLTEVSFPEESSLTSIGNSAFRSCSALSTFIMPNTVTSLGTSSFSSCTSLSNLTLSSSLTSIPNYCFQSTSSLRNVVFPEKLNSIGDYAFDASGLENVILPKGLTSLGNYAFRDCKSLQYIELPSYVGSYYYTFSGCNAITKVLCQSCTPPAINNYEPFYYVDKSQVTLQVPSFAVVDYKLDTYWYNFGTIEAMETDPTYAIVSGNLSLTNNRRPKNSLDMHIYTTGNVTVGGDAPMLIGNLTFNFNPTTPAYARLINKSPNMSVTGNGKLRFYVNSEKWYFFSPVADVALSSITHNEGSAFVFRYYNSQYRAENGVTSNKGSWQDVAADGVLRAGQGYICRSRESGWFEMPVTAADMVKALTHQNVSTTLSSYASENTANANWNYVGNPYPSYYDAYYMDFTAPITVWDNSSSSYKAYSIVDDNYVLSPMQGFFVQKPDEVNHILFKEEGRQVESTVNRALSRGSRFADSSRMLYDIQLSDGILTDETRAIINEQASLDYELGRDVAKFMSLDERVPQIYSIDKDGNRLAFNERPLENGKIRLGVYAGQAGTFTLKGASSYDGLSVYDAATGVTFDLGKGDYSFNVVGPGSYDDRFMLLLTRGGTTTIGSVSDKKDSVTAISGGIEVRSSSESDILVYDAAGRQISRAKAVSGKTVIRLQSGLYIVKIGNKSYKCLVD